MAVLILKLNNMMEKKIVLITGASSGIGEGCARKFAMNGYRLILNGRNVEKLNAVKKELLEKYGADVYLLPFDVRDRQAARAALESLPEEWKAVDILVNNAMTRLVVPGMVERGRGHVINMGSIAGDYAYPGGSVYCACKAAVKALSDGLRIDLVDTPVRVTNIKPGLVETNFSVVRFRGNREAADNVYKGIRPLTGDDIAEVVYFAAAVPEHIQLAEVLVMPANQATGTIVSRK